MIYCSQPLVFGYLFKGWCNAFILKGFGRRFDERSVDGCPVELIYAWQWEDISKHTYMFYPPSFNTVSGKYSELQAPAELTSSEQAGGLCGYLLLPLKPQHN